MNPFLTALSRRPLHSFLLALAVCAAAPADGFAQGHKQPAHEADKGSAVTGSLTRDEAVKLAQAAMEAHKVQNSPGLNANNVGGLEAAGQPLYFEYIPERKVLNVLALCYRFRKPPRPGLLEAYKKEEKFGTNTGGGTVEFRPETGGLLLSRTYTQKIDPARFNEEIDKLMLAGKYWAEEVLPAVATKVFGHDK